MGRTGVGLLDLLADGRMPMDKVEHLFQSPFISPCLGGGQSHLYLVESADYTYGKDTDRHRVVVCVCFL